MASLIKIRDESNTIRTITRIRMRDAAGVLRTITRVRMRDAGNVLRTVYGAFSAVVTAAVSGSSATSPVTSTSATATPTGGIAPYTYQWRAYNNDPATYNSQSIIITTPTAASTTFSKNLPPASDAFGEFECVVTDNVGTVVIASTTSVTLSRT